MCPESQNYIYTLVALVDTKPFTVAIDKSIFTYLQSIYLAGVVEDQ